MKYLDSVKRSARNLANAKMRTFLTAMAIGIGAFAMTLSFAAGEGVRGYVTNMLEANANENAIFVTKDVDLTSGITEPEVISEYNETNTSMHGGNYETLSIDDVEFLENHEKVSQVAPEYSMMIKHFGAEGSKKKYSGSVRQYDSTIKSEVSKGSLPDIGEQIADNGVVLSEALVKEIDGLNQENPVGQKIIVTVERGADGFSDEDVEKLQTGEATMEELQSKLEVKQKTVELEVIAVTKKSALSDSASDAVFISGKMAKELSEFTSEGSSQYQRYVAATVIVNDGVDKEALKAELQNNGYSVLLIEDLQQMIFQYVDMLQSIVAGFSAIAIIASIFGIINTQYISVLERTREIGLMKALGMRGGHVSRMFQLEAGWIGFLGGIIGAGFAVIAGLLMNPWISEQTGLGEMSLLIFNPLHVAGVVLSLMLVAVLAGWFPARKAAKMDPVSALRTE